VPLLRLIPWPRVRRPYASANKPANSPRCPPNRRSVSMLAASVRFLVHALKRLTTKLPKMRAVGQSRFPGMPKRAHRPSPADPSRARRAVRIRPRSSATHAPNARAKEQWQPLRPRPKAQGTRHKSPYILHPSFSVYLFLACHAPPTRARSQLPARLRLPRICPATSFRAVSSE